MKFPIPEFFKGLALTVSGSAITLRELLTNGSLLLTCAGAAMALCGGYWAYRAKRTESQLREVELEIRREELRALRSQSGTGADA